MDYNILLDMVTDLGYRLAMCGAETFRVEETVNRILSAYGLSSEVFAIPNCLTVSIEAVDGRSITRMKRIGYHGTDLDSVERYNALSRKICAEVPSPEEAIIWLQDTEASRKKYSLIMYLLGNFLGAAGYAVFFGGNLIDSLCAGICGVLVGIVNHFTDLMKVNPFFRTIAAAFLMAVPAYAMGSAGIAANTDAVIIGTLMILVPGLLFTNAMRDIIFGDTNSGMNRIVQVLLTAAAIALGTGAAWNFSDALWGAPDSILPIDYPFPIQILAAFIGCIGFFIVFNIHGPGGFICALGGALTWAIYLIVVHFSCNDVLGYFIASVVAAAYSESMARIRKYPAISYLLISIFPLIPGAGIYYTTNHLVKGNMDMFVSQGTHTIAIAGAIAVGILIVSTIVRLQTVWKEHKNV